jgi:hypothetical protein
MMPEDDEGICQILQNNAATTALAPIKTPL